MAASISDGDSDIIVGINVTPLVDVVLVLLIIFMVTATTIVREAIEVDLPRAAHGGETVGAMLNLVLDKEGRLFIDGIETPAAELTSRVAGALEKDKEARAIISADRSASHGAVVTLIDQVKGAGITRFALNIDKDVTAAAPEVP